MANANSVHDRYRTIVCASGAHFFPFQSSISVSTTIPQHHDPRRRPIFQGSILLPYSQATIRSTNVPPTTRIHARASIRCEEPQTVWPRPRIPPAIRSNPSRRIARNTPSKFAYHDRAKHIPVTTYIRIIRPTNQPFFQHQNLCNYPPDPEGW